MTGSKAKEPDNGFTVQAWLRKNGPGVARMLSEGRPVTQPVQISTVRRSKSSKVMRMTLEDRRAMIKWFNPDHPITQHGFTREATLLDQLADAGLVPPLLAFAREQRFVITEHVPGPTLEKHLSEVNVVETARALGRWYARFTEKMPGQAQDSNWYDYLSRYDGVLTQEERAKNRAFLGSLPIADMRVAKNDAHMSNFILDTAGDLRGFDFESATVKPYGWDILVTARVLVKAFPGQINEIVPALIDGWGQGTDCIEKADLQRLTLIFVLATSFKAMTKNRARLERYIDTYNAGLPKAGLRADTAFITPYGPDEMAPQDGALLAAFRTHLEHLATTALSTPPEPVPEHVLEPVETPMLALQAACGTCRGMCCHHGGERNRAYLKPQTMKVMQTDNPEVTVAEIVETYMRHIPDTRVAGSCFYHGARGCVLPRKMRSDTCNKFLCQSAKLIQESAARLSKPSGALLIAAHVAGALERASVLENGAIREIDPGQLVDSAEDPA